MMAAATVRLGGHQHHPFTVAQWKELERQAMIYKYMAASVPVPPDLLVPLTTDARFSSNCNYSLRFGRAGYAEPGRCKRTDGKKWRCSKEAIPDERYCDRHLKKRNRPRSRKPVETSSSMPCKKTTRRGQQPLADPTTTTCGNGSASNNSLAPVFLCSNVDGGFDKEARGLDWLTIGEHRLAEENHPNVYTGYDASRVNHHRFNEYLFSLDSDLVIPTQKPDTTISRGFIDAWSLSADAAEMNRIRIGLGVAQCHPSSSWIESGSWISSATPGGPLAEVLQHRSTSPSSESPQISSPSQKKLVSLSDSGSSVTVEPEITLQWFNPPTN